MKKEVILELYNGFEEAALETGGIIILPNFSTGAKVKEYCLSLH